MEFIFGLVSSVIFFGAVTLGVVELLRSAFTSKDDKDQAKINALEHYAGPILDRLFDGSGQVIYAPKDRCGGLTTPTLVKAAYVRGYKMTSETGTMAIRQVVFDKL
jgi:hypothetical protein